MRAKANAYLGDGSGQAIEYVTVECLNEIIKKQVVLQEIKDPRKELATSKRQKRIGSPSGVIATAHGTTRGALEPGGEACRKEGSSQN